MKSTKKIIIFNWRDPEDPKAGGAERVTLKHATYWAQQGHQVTWVAGTFPGCKAKVTKNGVHYLRSGNSQTLFLRAWWIFYHDLNGDADVIIDEVHGLPMFSPLWARGCKTIAFIHEVAQEIWDEMFPFPVNVIGKLIERHVFPFVYKDIQFWVDSSSTQNDLISLGIPKKHVQIIPCAIDLPSGIADVKREKRFTCVFLARLVKMKGVEYAIETFADIFKSKSDAQLWIVGSGDDLYVDTLRKKVEKLHMTKNVVFWGNVTEKKKYELLGRAHWLLHTSVREGFGLTVLEANSRKTPAAVFDVASLRDLVSEDKGVIVPFADTHILAQRILHQWHNQKRYLSLQKNAYTFSKRFSWRLFTKQSEQLFL